MVKFVRHKRESIPMKFSNICLIVSVLMLFIGCTSLDKMIRQRDYEALYRYALEMYQSKKNKKAIYLFDQMETVFRGTDKIDTILFYRAKAYYNNRDFITSNEYFDTFRKEHSDSPFLEEAEYLYAMSFYESAPMTELDQSYSMMAITAFQQFKARYPNSPKGESCDEMIAELENRIYDKSFVECETYYNIGAYNSAITSFRNALKQYPATPHRERILYMLVKSNYEYAKASVENKQRERYYGAIDAYLNFISEFPESEYRKDAERMYEIATRLSKGEELVEKVGEGLNLTDRKKARSEKKMLKAIDKIDKGKTTEEAVEEKAKKQMEAMQLRNDKKQSRDSLKQSRRGTIIEETLPTEEPKQEKE